MRKKVTNEIKLERYLAGAMKFEPGEPLQFTRPGQLVSYRTISYGRTSHIHAPVEWERINWTGRYLVNGRDCAQVIGRIYDFKMVS